MEYILLLKKAERLKAALDNTKIAYYELRKENEQLQQQAEELKNQSCEGCKWFRFPACGHPNVCSRMEEDLYEAEDNQ